MSNGTGRGLLRRVTRSAGVAIAPVIALLIGLAPLPAAAQVQEDFAVLSLVGDQIELVGYYPNIGSNLDRHKRRQVPLQDDGLDMAALIAADAAIKSQEPQAQTMLLKTRNPDHYKLQEQGTGSGVSASLLEALKPLVQQAGAKRLVLVTKNRADIRLAIMDGDLSRPGRLQGVGLYVDRVTEMKRVDTGEGSVGFIAPFAYLRVSLIDVPTMTVLSTGAAAETLTVSTANNRDAVDPWGALSEAEKAEYLKKAVSIGVRNAMGRMQLVR